MAKFAELQDIPGEEEKAPPPPELLNFFDIPLPPAAKTMLPPLPPKPLSAATSRMPFAFVVLPV